MKTEHIESEWRRLNNRADDFQPAPEAQRMMDHFIDGYMCAQAAMPKGETSSMATIRQDLDDARQNAQFWCDSAAFWRGECKADMREIARLTAIINANGLGGEQ